jgi:cell division septation protein DedD
MFCEAGMKYFFAIVAILALAGCGAIGGTTTATDGAGDVHAEAQAAVQECKDKHAKGDIKNYVGEALCANPKIVAAYRKAKYPYMDLVFLGVSAKLAGAVKVDAGQLSEEQYESEIVQLRERISTEERRRRAAGIMQSATNTPPEGLLDGLSAFETAANPNPTANAVPVVSISADTTAVPPPAMTTVDPAPPPAPAPPRQQAMAPPPRTPAAPSAAAPAPTPAVPTPAVPTPTVLHAGSGYRLQFGAFARQDNAARLTKAISSPDSQVAIETGQDRAGRPLYYVRSAVYPDLDKAQAAAKAAQATAQSQGFAEPVSYVVMAVGDGR